MKRVYIAVVILLLCGGFSTFSYFTIKNDCQTLITHAKKIESQLKTEDYYSIKKESEQIQKLWKRYTLPFSLLTTHFHYDAMEESAEKLYRAAESGDKKQIKSCCDEMIFEANHIITSICPKGQNVF